MLIVFKHSILTGLCSKDTKKNEEKKLFSALCWDICWLNTRPLANDGSSLGSVGCVQTSIFDKIGLKKDRKNEDMISSVMAGHPRSYNLP